MLNNIVCVYFEHLDYYIELDRKIKVLYKVNKSTGKRFHSEVLDKNTFQEVDNAIKKQMKGQ